MIWARVSIASGLDPGLLAKPVEPSSVSFEPSKAPGEWSMSVTVEDVRPSDTARTRNGAPRFRERGR